MDRAVDARHFVDKPKAEVMACIQCHSVATKCDSCHTRHLFDPAEARRPEACITCHSGPPHPDDETYFASAHGKLYLAEGDRWDWSKPLVKGNYKSPTCAYCHMDGGRHQVAHKSLWKFGLREVNPNTSGNRVLRERWVAVCADCHEECLRCHTEQLAAGDRLTEIARVKVREAEELAARHHEGATGFSGHLESIGRHLANVRLGAGHQHPDYQWWHGLPALDGDLIRLRHRVAQAMRQPAVSSPVAAQSEDAGTSKVGFHR
jgi:hypothetical protein